MKKLGIYIHIPFCKKKCKYCDFISFPASQKQQNQYIQMLGQEIQKKASLFQDYSVDTVYIGGGTPSVIDPQKLCEIIECVRRYYRVLSKAEISMEVNPGTVSLQALSLYHEAGVNRISVGLQSTKERELKLLGRIHGYEDFLRSYDFIKTAGFQNVNIDLMSGLPGQTVKDVRDSLAKIIHLSPVPQHISSYGLILEPGTPFYETYYQSTERESKVHSGMEKHKTLPSQEEECEMYEQTEEILASAGLYRYEISNYAKKGYICRHNMKYWEREEYLGFGMGAASLIGNVRYKNFSEMSSYEAAINSLSWESPTLQTGEERQVLSMEEQMEEFLFLGLRKVEGISKQEFSRLFHVDLEKLYSAVLQKNEALGLLNNEEWVRLTKRGLLLSNYVMSQFLLERNQLGMALQER